MSKGKAGWLFMKKCRFAKCEGLGNEGIEKNGINCSNYCAYSGFLVFKCNSCKWCKFCAASGHSRVCLTPELWTLLEDIVDIL